MPESIAAVLEKPGGQPERFDTAWKMLHNTRHRLAYHDYVDKVTRRKSARYSAAMLDRADFYAEIAKRRCPPS